MTSFGLYDLGCTTVYAARRDPRFSYCLYVPPKFRSAAVQPELIVVVHGSPRSFMDLRDRFQDLGLANNAMILSPLFPVGVGGDGNPDGYKYLSEPMLRYDEILLDIVAEVGARWQVPFDQFALFGFSGGAQFAHRFLLLRPERLWAASLGAPGSVTLLDDSRDWWVGIGNIEGRFGITLNLDALRRVPVQMLVGSADLDTSEITHREGGRNWMPGANDAGASRPERLAALQRSLSAAGVAVTHEVIVGAAHEVAPVIERAKPFLATQLSRFRGRVAPAEVFSDP
jgi:pimeloyl-ACP methyl ester carboxylesterase